MVPLVFSLTTKGASWFDIVEKKKEKKTKKQVIDVLYIQTFKSELIWIKEEYRLKRATSFINCCDIFKIFWTEYL